MLSFIIWLPIAFALLLALLPVREPRLARLLALLPMLGMLAVALRVFAGAPASGAEYAFTERIPWVTGLGISYHLGVNRLGALLILLTSLVGTAAVLVSKVERGARFFYALGLVVVGGMAGAFASLDLFFLYIFHEFGLIPTFILIGVWGAERRRPAAMKITLYLMLGSMVLLLGLIALVFAAGGGSFDLVTLKGQLQATPLSVDQQVRIFGLLFVGFAILISAVPFHTWAPIGYGEAPPLAAMLHAGVIKKFGFFGLMVVAVPLLPEGFQQWRPWIAGVGVANLIYAGYVALRQRDLRYMLAYASVSHMGFGFLALAAGTPLAMQGLALFLFAHGLAAAVGFGAAGFCREQAGTTEMVEMGGLARRMPVAAAIFTMAAFAGCGLPGFANFPSELLIFLGSFRTFPWPTVLALWATVVSAVYLLRAVRAVFLGTEASCAVGVRDMGWRHRAGLGLLLAVLLTAGFWPRGFMPSAPTVSSQRVEVSLD